MKLRWTNGYGDEQGNQYPYNYWVMYLGKRYNLDANAFEKYLEKNNLTLKDFRGSNEIELTKNVLNDFFYIKYIVSFKEARRKANLTQTQIVELTGISLRLYQDLENGEYDINSMSFGSVKRLCHFLGIDLNKLNWF